jgi:hypothetical protein
MRAAAADDKADRSGRQPSMQVTAFDSVRVAAPGKPRFVRVYAGGEFESPDTIDPDLLDGVLEFDRLFSEQVGMMALRPEAKLLLILTRHGSLRIKQAMSLSGLSYRGFYILLQRLVKQKLVIVEGDSADGRVRNIRLGKAISIVDQRSVASPEVGAAVS